MDPTLKGLLPLISICILVTCSLLMQIKDKRISEIENVVSCIVTLVTQTSILTLLNILKNQCLLYCGGHGKKKKLDLFIFMFICILFMCITIINQTICTWNYVGHFVNLDFHICFILTIQLFSMKITTVSPHT